MKRKVKVLSKSVGIGFLIDLSLSIFEEIELFIKYLIRKLFQIINKDQFYIVVILMLMLLIISEATTMFYRFKVKKSISFYLQKYNNILYDSGYKIKYSSFSFSKIPLKVGINLKDLLIESDNDENIYEYIKIPTVFIGCDIFSCIFNKISLIPSISVEFKTKTYQDKMLISFNSNPSILIKNLLNNDSYVYYKAPKHEIFNLTQNTRLASIDEIDVLYRETVIGGFKKIKLGGNFKSKDLSGIDYILGNEKSIFIDVGRIDFDFLLNGNLKIEDSKIPSFFELNLKKFSFKTSSFKINAKINARSSKNWKDFYLDGKVDFLKYKNFLDWIGNMIINTSDNSILKSIIIVYFPKISKKILPEICKIEDEIVNLEIETKNNEIYINNKSLRNIFYMLYENNGNY